MGDFFSFRKMVTPIIIKAIYAIGAVGGIIYTFYFKNPYLHSGGISAIM